MARSSRKTARGLGRDKAARLHLGMENGSRLDHQTQGPHVFRVDGAQHPAGLDGMDRGALRAGDAEQHGHRQVNAGGLCLAGQGDHLGCGRALVDGGQGRVVAAFQAHVGDAQAELPQFRQFRHCFRLETFAVGIDAHSGNLRHSRSNPFEEGAQPRLRQDQGVAVAEEEAPDRGKMAGRIIDIGPDNLLGGDSEALPLVHAAKGALVVGATGGYLQQDAVGLAGRTVDGSLVVHIVDNGSIR